MADTQQDMTAMSRSLNGVLDIMTTVVTQDGLNDIIAKVIQKEVSIKHDAMQDSLNTTVGHKLMLAQTCFRQHQALAVQLYTC